MLCEYGCGQEAKYQLKNGKWCCSKSYNSCPVARKNKSKVMKGRKRKVGIRIKQNNIICSYGCNQLANYYFEYSNKYCCSSHYTKCTNERLKCKFRVTGYKNPMYNKHHTKDAKLKISKKMFGENHPRYNKHHTEESKEKIRKNHSPNSGRQKGVKNIDLFGEKKAKEISKKISESNEGRTLSKEQIEQIKIRMKGEGNHMFGKKHKKNSKDIMKQKAKLRFKNPDFLNKWVASITNKELNKPEKFLNDLLTNLFNNEYKFVGNYSMWIGGKNPDFINKKRKKIIEYFGNWWHSERRTGIPEKLEDKQRENHFEKFGYDVIIIRERHLKNIENLKIKLKEFNNA